MRRRGAPWLFVAIVACLASCEGSPSVLNPRPEDPSSSGPFEPDDNSGFGSQTPSPTSTSVTGDPIVSPPFLDTGGRGADAGIPTTDAGADAASGDSGADSDATVPDAQ